MIYNAYLGGETSSGELYSFVTQSDYPLRLNSPLIREMIVPLMYNPNLEYVKLNNCWKLPTYAFEYCPNLSYISLPKFYSGGNSAFEGCSALRSLTLPLYSGSINLAGCVALSYLELPRISSLSRADLQYGSRSADDTREYQLRTVKLNNCKSLDGGTFLHCSHLSSVYLLSTVLPTFDGSVPFPQLPDLKIYIPSTKLDWAMYRWANDGYYQWSNNGYSRAFLKEHLVGVDYEA